MNTKFEFRVNECEVQLVGDGYGAFQWSGLCSLGSKTPGRWFLICNVELARMQGVPGGGIHFNCVMDNFGDLVRVPA